MGRKAAQHCIVRPRAAKWPINLWWDQRLQSDPPVCNAAKGRKVAHNCVFGKHPEFAEFTLYHIMRFFTIEVDIYIYRVEIPINNILAPWRKLRRCKKPEKMLLKFPLNHPVASESMLIWHFIGHSWNIAQSNFRVFVLVP